MRRAFTLFEVVFAVAVSAVVMFGCASLFFDMVHTADSLRGNWTLRAHADGVERFLRASFVHSSISDVSKLSDAVFARNKNSLCFARLPEQERGADYHLAFSDKTANPLYVSATGAVGEKLCFLDLTEGEGLFVVWTFVQSEDRKNASAVYRTQLSPFVREMYFIYKDATLWKEEAAIDSRAKMPQFLKLVFERGGERIERVVSLGSQIDYQVGR